MSAIHHPVVMTIFFPGSKVWSDTVSQILTAAVSEVCTDVRHVPEILAFPRISGWRGAFLRHTSQVDVLAVLWLTPDLTDGSRWSN